MDAYAILALTTHTDHEQLESQGILRDQGGGEVGTFNFLIFVL